MAAARGDAYNARTAPAQPSSGAIGMRTVPPGNRRIANAPAAPPVATAAAPSSGARLIYVCIEARVGKQVCHHLGQVSRSHSAERPVPEIIEECLKSWNEDFWERNSEGSLSREDVSLRWHGNVMPEPETEGRMLGDFYDMHYGQPHRLTYFGRGPKTLKARELKGVQQIFLELVIDVKGFAERTDCAPPSQLQGTSKGRPPKRRDRSASPSRTLIIASTTINPDDCTLAVSWDVDDGAKLCKADFSEMVSWSGKTKHVFIDIDLKDGKPPQPFVAKRFFNIGGEGGDVSCTDNAHFLTLEAQRLELGNMYLSEFYKHARTQGADVSTDFGFTPYLLARENTEPGLDGATPSKASGISPEKWKSDWPFSDWDAGIVWLLEPRRSHLIDRWSGTLSQPSRQNKRFATMGAFAHFSMLLSENSMVFVDLQSSYGNLRDGHGYGRVLFDPMTHSLSGNTGVGDHGLEGLGTFIDDHQCTSICSQLDLEALTKDELPAEGGEVDTRGANQESESESNDEDQD
ncbi:kinase-like domain-containing protein [Ganoderma leucocontextum]|nr:kinase-like domain-containing protein [Ganoderma leucocontextum]